MTADKAPLPALLATELTLPCPIDRDAGEVSTSPKGCSPTARINSKAFRKMQKAAVTPYQALPVQGPLVSITHHMTPALPVVEPEDSSKKVRIADLLSGQLLSLTTTQPLTILERLLPTLAERLASKAFRGKVHKEQDEVKLCCRTWTSA